MPKRFMVKRTYFVEFPDDLTLAEVQRRLDLADDGEYVSESWDEAALSVAMVVDVGDMTEYVTDITHEVKPF